MWLTVGDLMIRAFGLTNFEKFILSIRDDFLDTKRGLSIQLRALSLVLKLRY